MTDEEKTLVKQFLLEDCVSPIRARSSYDEHVGYQCMLCYVFVENDTFSKPEAKEFPHSKTCKYLSVANLLNT